MARSAPQWSTCIETNAGLTSYQRVHGKSRIERRVRYLHYLFRLLDRVCTECMLARCLTCLKTHAPLEPLSLFVDQRNERDRRFAEGSCHARELIVGFVFFAIHDVQRGQLGKPSLLGPRLGVQPASVVYGRHVRLLLPCRWIEPVHGSVKRPRQIRECIRLGK